MFLTQFICLFCCCLMSLSAHASNALRGKNFSSNQPSAERKELNINKEFVKHGREVGISTNDVAAVIPTNLSTTNKGNYVRDRILIKSANSIAKSPMIHNSFLMKTAKKVEKKTAVGMNIKSTPTVTNAAPIEHKFKFNLKAFKKEARISYSGYVDSKVEYKAKDDSFHFSIEEKLSKNSKIALTHQKNRFDKRQFLHYQLSW